MENIILRNIMKNFVSYGHSLRGMKWKDSKLNKLRKSKNNLKSNNTRKNNINQKNKMPMIPGVGIKID